MRILHISASDVAGGAAKAMYRLHESLTRAGHTSHAIVGSRLSNDPHVEWIDAHSTGLQSISDKVLNRAGLAIRTFAGVESWSHPRSLRVATTPLFGQADIVHLHNLHGHYFNLKALVRFARVKPIVWTLHDMWPLTGHCAYSYDCDRWRCGCYECPLLKSPGREIVEPKAESFDHTKRRWRQKRSIYRSAQLHIVTPSHWLGKLVEASILAGAISKHTIPYGVDLNLFRPADKLECRVALGLPLDQNIVFFSADNVANKRKGFSYLLRALARVPLLGRRLWLLTTGTGLAASEVPADVQVRNLGYVDDRLQRLAYCAADVLAFPSLADNLPFVLIEALACGTPVVAFDVGGVSEVVTHNKTGYLARYEDVDDLSFGLATILDDRELQARLATNCRDAAQANFGLELQAERYISIYRTVRLSRSSDVGH